MKLDKFTIKLIFIHHTVKNNFSLSSQQKVSGFITEISKENGNISVIRDYLYRAFEKKSSSINFFIRERKVLIHDTKNIFFCSQRSFRCICYMFCAYFFMQLLHIFE